MAKGTFTKAEWCPFCGVKSLERDRYGETKEIPTYKNEFLCSACGKGITIGPSTRHMLATRLAKGHREMRPPDERPPKIKPDDIELYTLQKYGEKIGLPSRIIRSKNKIAKFNFLHPTKTACLGSLDFRGAMQFLRGFEIAERLRIEK